MDDLGVEAAQAEAVGQPWTAHSPFPVSALKRILKADRIAGAVEQCDLSYRDAHHDRVGRRFLGFREVTETFAGDAAGASRRIVHEFATRDVLRLTGAALAEAQPWPARVAASSRRRRVGRAPPGDRDGLGGDGGARLVGRRARGPAQPRRPARTAADGRRDARAPRGLGGGVGRALSARRAPVRRARHPGVPDEFGNLREEIDHGEVALQGVGPALATIDVDGGALASTTSPMGPRSSPATATRYRRPTSSAGSARRRPGPARCHGARRRGAPGTTTAGPAATATCRSARSRRATCSAGSASSRSSRTSRRCSVRAS